MVYRGIAQYADAALSEGGEHPNGYTGYIPPVCTRTVGCSGWKEKYQKTVNELIYTPPLIIEVATPSIEHERMITEDHQRPLIQTM